MPKHYPPRSDLESHHSKTALFKTEWAEECLTVTRLGANHEEFRKSEKC